MADELNLKLLYKDNIKPICYVTGTAGPPMALVISINLLPMLSVLSGERNGGKDV